MIKEGDTLPIITWDMYRREKGVNGPIGHSAAWDKAPPRIWQKWNSEKMFKDRCVVIGIPGAWTDKCTHQLQMFDGQFDMMYTKDIENIYFIGVNDSFCMQSWLWAHFVIKADWIADGNGDFTEKIGMLVDKSNMGYSKRSWRYAMVVENNTVEQLFVEDGKEDNVAHDVDPYKETHWDNVYKYLISTGRRQDPPDETRWYYDVPSAERIKQEGDPVPFDELLRAGALEDAKWNRENADYINFDPNKDSIAHKELEELEQAKRDQNMEDGMLGS